tara:strand:+ start:296 stop:475 length:180 start_codon:yes stop_codon:yes gene_type:complete
MSEYKANIRKSKDGAFHAMIVRVDYDGETSVINSYEGRYFKTEKAAIRSTDKYIAKYCQ